MEDLFTIYTVIRDRNFLHCIEDFVSSVGWVISLTRFSFILGYKNSHCEGTLRHREVLRRSTADCSSRKYIL